MWRTCSPEEFLVRPSSCGAKINTCFSLKLEFIGPCNCMIKLKQPAIISFKSLHYIVQKVHMCMHVNIIFKFISEYMFVLFGSMKITQKSFTWIKLTMVTHTRPISIMWKVFDAGINRREKNTVGIHNGVHFTARHLTRSWWVTCFCHGAEGDDVAHSYKAFRHTLWFTLLWTSRHEYTLDSYHAPFSKCLNIV